MDKYEVIFESLQERVNKGELTMEQAERLNDMAYAKYVTEASKSSPLKDMLPKLKKIKDAKPSEYDGQEEVKEFVDKYYDDITKSTDLLQEEPAKLSKANKNYLLRFCLSLIGYVGGLALTSILPAAGAAIIVGSTVFMVIDSIVSIIVQNARAEADTTAMKDLSKVKTALKKLDSKKLPDKYKKKVSKLIQEIDDAETEIYGKIKEVKESAYNDIADEIQTAVNNGELTYEEGVNMNITAYGKLMTESK